MLPRSAESVTTRDLNRTPNTGVYGGNRDFRVLALSAHFAWYSEVSVRRFSPEFSFAILSGTRSGRRFQQSWATEVGRVHTQFSFAKGRNGDRQNAISVGSFQIKSDDFLKQLSSSHRK